MTQQAKELGLKLSLGLVLILAALICANIIAANPAP